MNDTGQSRFEPMTWLVLFATSSSMKWVDRLVPGRFKHVMAAGWVEASKVWIFYDVQFRRTRIMTMPEKEGLEYFGQCIRRGEAYGLLRVPVKERTQSLLRWGFWCVPAVKHLIGLRSGALRPDRLWGDCLLAGAEIVHEKSPSPPALSAVGAGSRGAKGG